MCGGGDKYKNANYNDPNYEGPEVDDNLKDGPIEKRGCTDICCCNIFIAFCVGCGYIISIALVNGDPMRLKAAYDA
jgi:hypothetical protein